MTSPQFRKLALSLPEAVPFFARGYEGHADFREATPLQAPEAWDAPQRFPST